MNVLRLTLRQLQIFVAVARCGSTTAASAELALSQSATSSAINELERLLSMPLFERSGKRLLLNDNGRSLQPQALAMLDCAAQIEQMARDGLAQTESLRIGASTTLGNYVVPQLLGQLLGQLHNTSATWHSKVLIGNTKSICNAVAAFELDIGLIEGPSHHARLTATPWLRDELLVVSAQPNPRCLSLNALRDAVWLLREPGSGTREATDQMLLPHLQSYRRSIELGSSQALKQAAAQGLGLTCLSQWVVGDFIASQRLHRVITTLPKMSRQCYFVVHQDKQPTPALLRLMTLAVAFAHAQGGPKTALPTSTNHA
ncbi:HTH-type transcriptional activator CmpR [mine drainage metagenome]|uniref:HTH-type transcriptional activator CmpR n=1 Tax=mine drainage metagenome TaxID=410659 RepID=A0A1J5PJN6_9ZZZZ